MSPELRRRELLGSAAGLLALAHASGAPAQVRRREFHVQTRERFDPTGIEPYAENHPRVYRHIDDHLEDHVEQLRRWLKQPSVSAEGRGIEEMATLLRDDLRELGFQEAELAPTDGHPGVFGSYDAGAQRTLLVYMMYDVQPVELDAWSVDPFAAELRDHELGQVVMGRGAINQKGPERAFLNAIGSILATEGRLPVNLLIAAEGEEELGSPHYPQVISRYEDRLRKADAVLFPAPRQTATGTAGIRLGVKGIVYFEMEAVGGASGGPTRAPIHSSFKSIVDAPAWRLVQALASLTTPDGNTIRVPGYYDPIREPTLEEQRLVNAMRETWDDTVMQKTYGVEQWTEGMTGERAILHYLYNTTLNIDGIWGGYTGPGTKTVLPHKATAKIDSRLVPNQNPEDALRLIRAHLDREGFSDVVIRKLAGYPPAQTSVEAPVVRTTISVYRKYGVVLSVWPRTGGSAPYYLFTDRLGLPMISAGLGHGGGFHAPDEYLVLRPKKGSKIAGLAEMERFYVDLLYALG